MLILGIKYVQDIEANGVIHIHGIEVDDVIHPVLWDLGQHFFHEFAVRVNDAHAMSRSNVLQSHIFQENGLSHPGLADHIHVLAAVVLFYAEDLV